MPSIAEVFVRVLPDTSELADGIRRALRSMDSEMAEAGRRWGNEIQRGMGTVRVNVDVDGAAARAELDRLTRDRRMTVHVDVDRNALNRLTSLIGSHFSQTNFLSQMFNTTNTQSITYNIGNAVSQGMSQGGSAGVGMMRPALLGVGAIVAAGIASSLSGLAGLIPGALLGAGGLVGTLVVGLDGVKEAYDAVGKAAESSGTDQAEQAKKVASAQQGLTDAVNDQAQAQQDVSDAYREARQNLDDLNLSLQGGQISEAQAYNNVLKARRDLAQGNFKDALDLRDAQLRVASSEQSWQEARQRNTQLQEKVNDANAKGVESSDAVTAAQQRLAAVNQQVATAQSALNEAQSESSSAMQEAVDAMAKLSPAQQQFVETLQAMKPMFMDFKNAIGESLFAGLAPQFQQLTTTYLPLLQSFMGSMATTLNQTFGQISQMLMRPEMQSVMQSTFANLGQAFQIFMQGLTPLTEGFLRFAEVGSGFLPQLSEMFVGMANSFNEFAQSGQLQEWIQTAMDGFGELVKMLPTIMQMLGDLAPIGLPALQMLNTVLEALQPAMAPLAELFGALITSATPWLELLTQVATTIVQALAPAMTTWIDALSPVAAELAGTFTSLWQELGPVLNEVAMALVDELLPVVQEMIPYIAPLAQQFQNLVSAVIPFIPVIADLMIQMSPIIQLTLPGLTQAFITLMPFLTSFVQTLTNFATNALPIVKAGVSALGDVFSAVFGTIKDVVSGVWDVIKPIFENIGEFLDRLPGPLKKFLDIGDSAPGSRGGTVLKSPTRPPTTSPGGSFWDKIADKESSGNWFDDNSGGHTTSSGAPRGGLQITDGTWKSFGGTEFAPTAAQATKEQQIEVANRIAFNGYAGQEPQGLGAWEVITKGMVPGVTPDTKPALMPTTPAPAAPAPTGSAREYAHSVAMPYWQSQGLEVGDHQADQYGEHQNGAIDIMVSTLQEGNAVLQQVLADPNVYGAIFNNKVYGYGQGPEGRDYSAGHTGDPNQDHTNHVHAWYKPGNADNINPGGADPSSYLSPVMRGASSDDPMYVALPDAQVESMSGGEQLGKDIFSGLAEIIGIDGSVFKDPTQFGLFKIFKGVMGLKPSEGGGGAAGGGGGGIGGMLSGIMGFTPQAFGELNPGSPGDAPGEFMPSMPGAGGGAINIPALAASGQTGAPGPGNVDNSITVNGVQNPGPAFDAANQANVPRMRQGLRNVPG